MRFPTWESLLNGYCSYPSIKPSSADGDGRTVNNPRFEEWASRRFNYSPRPDRLECRLVFLRAASQKHSHRTLRRDGRFIWCGDLRYEGRDPYGYRQVSFVVDKGHKRFTVSENNMLCLPSKTYVGNNKYFRRKDRIFQSFSTVFEYNNTLTMMQKSSNFGPAEFRSLLDGDSPYTPGTLVAPRVGYFYPTAPHGAPSAEHPCGIILGRHLFDSYLGKEFYRVRFGDTTYEQVHPVEMEILNEV